MLLAHKDGFVAKEIQLDQVDLPHDSLAMLTAETINPVTLTTRTPKRVGRSSTAIAAALMGIASFGTTIFNTAQMAQLKSDIGVQSDRQKLIIEQLEEQDLRIYIVTQFISKLYADLNNLVRTSVTLNRQQAMKSLEQQVQLLLHSFRFELTDFLQGVTSLIENRLSPLIISLESLNSAFDMLILNARKHNLVPSGEDPVILFQVPVSTLCDNVANLYAVIHLPLY